MLGTEFRDLVVAFIVTTWSSWGLALRDIGSWDDSSEEGMVCICIGKGSFMALE